METLIFSATSEWSSWLEARNDGQDEAWLQIGKRHAAVNLISIADAGDVALCFGWIDGHRRAYDKVSFLQRYSRRRPKGSWSRVNVLRAESLIAAGRMRPAGLAEIDRAKADGRWEAAYEPQRTASVPVDLSAALEADLLARTAFERLSRSDRYALMLPLLKTYTPASRANALARIIAQLTASSVLLEQPEAGA